MREKYIPIIQEIANGVRKKNGLKNSTVIGDYIFTILQQECIVMMRPIRHQPDLDGFSTEKVVKEHLETIVIINTAKNVEKQNFCAAHELGHRYSLDQLIRDKFPDDIIVHSDAEEIMNRFAAELMMPEKDFRERSKVIWNKYGEYSRNNTFQITAKAAIQAIIELMDFYYMPYKAVLYRLEEVGVIPVFVRNSLEKLEGKYRNLVNEMISEMGITRLRTPDYKKQNSVPVKKDRAIIQDSRITKYLTEKELTQYSKNLGLSKGTIALASKMREIETEMLDLSGESEEIEEPEEK